MSGCKLVRKGCSQSWKHQEGVWQASSVCLHFPSDTSMLISLSIAICPHVYLTPLSLSLSVSISPVSRGGQPWAESLQGLWEAPKRVMGRASERRGWSVRVGTPCLREGLGSYALHGLVICPSPDISVAPSCP